MKSLVRIIFFVKNVKKIEKNSKKFKKIAKNAIFRFSDFRQKIGLFGRN